MIEKEFEVKNKLGLHARPASVFVQTANRFECHIEVEKDGEKVNGKSIMGIMTLAADMGSKVTIYFDGKDESKALDAITNLFETNFGENE